MIKLIKGDITQWKVDAIVNASNNALSNGAGVNGAIHHAAGPALSAACRKLNGCETGDAKITPGFNLPAKYIIHTVGPVWHGGDHDEASLLTSSYQNSLKLAYENNIKTIAFPAISTGIFGYPLKEATTIAITAANAFLKQHSDIEIIFVCFDETSFSVYQQLVK